MFVKVVVVVLFHYGNKYEYFYNDIVLKWLWVKYFQSKIFYRGNVDKKFLISFLTLPIDTQSLIVCGAAFQNLFPSFRNVVNFSPEHFGF